MPLTRQGESLYAHLYTHNTKKHAGVKGPIVIKQLASKPKSVKLLSSGQKVESVYDVKMQTLTITPSKGQLDKFSTIVEIQK